MGVDIQFDEFDLSKMVKHWVDAYEVPQGKKILDYDYWIDPTKGKCVVKLVIEDEL